MNVVFWQKSISKGHGSTIKSSLKTFFPKSASSKYVSSSKIIRFEKPSEKKEIKMISPDNLDELIDILHNKVKVIWYVCIGIYWNRK